MPKLLFVAACEKVILSNEQTISLITIMESVNVGLSKSVPTDTPVSIPMTWYVTSLWQREPEDKDGVYFEQMARLVLEDGTVAVKTDALPIEFKEGKFNNRGVFRIFGFPVPTQSTKANIDLLIRPKSDRDAWTKAFSIPIFISRTTEEHVAAL